MNVEINMVEEGILRLWDALGLGICCWSAVLYLGKDTLCKGDVAGSWLCQMFWFLPPASSPKCMTALHCKNTLARNCRQKVVRKFIWTCFMSSQAPGPPHSLLYAWLVVVFQDLSQLSSPFHSCSEAFSIVQLQGAAASWTWKACAVQLSGGSALRLHYHSSCLLLLSCKLSLYCLFLAAL